VETNTSSEPAGNVHRTVTPYLKLPNSAALVEFLTKAFGAVEQGRLVKPDGTLLHCEMLIGDSPVMVHESPPNWKGKPSTLYLRVADTDATYARAVAAGATPVFEPANMYYGARVACVTDVSGNDWWIAAEAEKLTLEEIQTRAVDFVKSRIGAAEAGR
jgi:PhnB protein